MVQRTQAILLLGFAALGALLLIFAIPLRAADPLPIACPSGQTTFVQGRAPANEPLLLFFNGRAVGGGLADRSGAYRLPLRAQERPGRYPVEVRLRFNRTVVERFTCFVDISLDSTPLASATSAPNGQNRPTGAPGAPAAPNPTRAVSPTLGPPPGLGRSATPTTPGAGSTATTRGTSTVTPTGPTATPTLTPTGPTATPTQTLGPGTPSPTATQTATPLAGDIRITDVALLDPAFANSVEYVRIENRPGGRVANIQGWRLVNASRPDSTRVQVPAYIFPPFTFNGGATIAVYSESGENNLEDGDFFWNQTPPVWKAGDRAELRDANGNLVSAWTVSND